MANNNEHIPSEGSPSEQDESVNPWDNLSVMAEIDRAYWAASMERNGYIPTHGARVNRGRAIRAVIDNQYQGFADDLDM